MTVHQEAARQPRSPTTSARVSAGVCLLGGALAAAAVPVLGSSFAGDSGASATQGALDNGVRLQLASIIATLAAAALILAAVRLSNRVGGTAGQVAGMAGAAVAVLLAAYYASFAAATAVGSFILETPSDGLGESALVVANMVELARYAPGLALVVAAVAAGSTLPKPLRISAGLLALMTIAPMTSWVAAMAIPVWLGVAGAFGRNLEESQR